MNEAEWLPIVFVCLMGLAILIYAILDGYDLGVGILLPLDKTKSTDRDVMISSIGPFWDANETWLVLAVGLLLIAFPSAHSIVLRELYIPAVIMLSGLILRGVAFDFRAKAISTHKETWDALFKIGSIVTSMSQGFMLGMYVMGFETTLSAHLFALVSAVCVTAAYAFIGAAWLVLKTEERLQIDAARLGRKAGWLTAAGIVIVSAINPWINSDVFDKWFSFPEVFLLFPIPLVCTVLFIICDRYLSTMPHRDDMGSWIPFVCAALIFFLCFQSLAYSYFPYVVPGQMTIWQAASAPESLKFILVGAVIVVPTILLYTAFSYRVFWGKTRELHYY